MIAKNPTAAATRQRLLEAAGAVFAETGFRQATIRDIVARAGANVAAVNYHFRDKEGLYTAVLEHAAKAALRKYPPYGNLSPEAPPKEQLKAFIQAFLQRIFDQDRDSIYGRLMAREMVEPTAALSRIVEQVIRPLYGRLCAIVRRLAGPRAGIDRVERAAKSIVGQILFYKLCAPVLEKLEGRAPDARDLKVLADHIAAFSLEGLAGLRTARKGRR